MGVLFNDTVDIIEYIAKLWQTCFYGGNAELGIASYLTRISYLVTMYFLTSIYSNFTFVD